MRQFLSHFKHSKEHTEHTVLGDASIPPSFYGEQDIFRFRKQRGVNLGSWFVLERWIADAPFREAAHPAQSDLDVARGNDAKVILEEHWNAWINEGDWAWMKERGFNAVRIPIGYYHLAGLDPSLLDGTDFEGLADVFMNAWPKIKEAFELAYKYRIGILIDLHAAPGKQNADSHSGTSNEPTFFSSRSNLQHATHVLTTLLTHLNQFLHTHNPPLPNLIGIELLNEPHPPSDSVLQSWYSTTIHKLRSIDSTIPLYLGECWRLDTYTNWLTSKHFSASGLVVLDHHLYRCFTSSDICTSASAHCAALDPDANSHTAQQFSTLSEKLGGFPGGSGLVVGEWSGALNPGSLTSSTTGGWEETKKYIEAQLRLYDRTCAGSFFWTFKEQHPGDKGWSLCDAVGAGTFPNRIGLRLTGANEVDIDPEEVLEAKTARKAVAAENHRNWWSQYPGQYMHWRFEAGYDSGWDSAFHFFTFNLNGRDSLTELGFARAWAQHQTDDHGQNYWEFEHGFLQAMDGAREFLKTRYGFN
ncbi:glycoside hydrolase family 5 protein [Macrolepiota fuliginosa MF-IS2]|uniref:Glycoside hydrolase family 5 protein n=1 Tax=Macrolepiota fuliginosa MF-IS2 TaxID=1400762 RepID=A0A9P5XFY9_9AGAR|nr:glycoside hydrolase family 5 protein [Macrolepiota fuliginosa MF-IS2]